MTVADLSDGAAAAEGSGAGSLYVQNMCALWGVDARLAMAVEGVAPEDVPVAERAKDGGWTVRVGVEGTEALRHKGTEGEGRELYLHSRYKPLAEAEVWVGTVGCEEKYVVVVNGFGLGHHVKALFEKMPGEGLLVVSEPNLGLLKAALQAVDLREMLGSGRVMIFTSLARGELVERLEARGALFTAGEGTLFASHPASMQAAGEFHIAFQKLVTEFVAFTRTGFITLMLNNVITCKNIANNMGRYVTTPPLDLLHQAFAGMPAILVAAGPSLAKNMHLLKEVVEEREGTEALRHKGTKGGDATTGVTAELVEPRRRKGAKGEDATTTAGVTTEGTETTETREGTGATAGKKKSGRRAVIIAVQTMLKPLLAAGIEPDFVTSLDYNTVSTRFFENLEESGSTGRVHLVAEAKANWNVLDVFGGTMSVLHNDFATKLLREGISPRMGLKAGATVAHLSFYLAEFLGCEPIILTGQDLGFVDGLYYKPGTAIHETWGVELGRFNTLETKEWERIVRSRQILRKIPDVHGHPMYTEEQFFVYLQQFERDFAASRHQVIDATEGGARKAGVTVMRLREAIDRFCGRDIEEGTVGGKRAWKTWGCDAAGNMRRALEALGRQKGRTVEMRETCEETLPLLEQMIEAQGDEGRMQELFVAVDRVRSRVGADSMTFEMVANLNTIGELRRYQADLIVKSAGDDAKERQKRQLIRDVEYVKDLKVGAERLEEILTAAMVRIEGQVAAMEEGGAWPREVAGSAENAGTKAQRH